MSYGRQQRNRNERIRTHTQRGRLVIAEQEFTCAHCHLLVSCATIISRVRNRNHCPYCLWSRHLDWRTAGDRLSACRAQMRPVGLTTKHSRNRYARERDGELMLVHQCTRCAVLVINRIAADDSIAGLVEVFEESCAPGAFGLTGADRTAVAMLAADDDQLVQLRLLGKRTSGEVEMLFQHG